MACFLTQTLSDGIPGLGKTFLAQLIAKEYEPQQITVIVLPLLSLHHDFRRRCSEAGVYATRWKPGFEETRPLGKIVHVSVEHALYKEFGVFLKTLQAQGKLARIWFDEAHLALLHADFRPVFLDLVALRLHDVPLVLTTATCPPHLEETLKSMFCIDRARIIRAPTERREAEYRFTQCTDVSSVIVARTYLRERVKSYDPADRFMVFCRSKADCDSVAVALNVEAYHSEIPEADRDARFDRWLHGGSSRPMPGIAATTLLTQGTDVPHVRDVVFVYLPRDPFEAAQALGRGGRDGAPFVFTVFWSSGDWNTDQNVKFGGEMMKRIVTDARTCRRAWFSSYFDGDNCGQMCATLPGIFCDICQSQVDEEVPTGLDVFPRGILGNAREVNPTAASYVPPRTAHTHVVSIPQGAEPPQAGRARTVPSPHVDGPTAAPLAPCPPAPTAIPLAPCPPEPTPQAANGIPHGPARKPRAQGLFDYRPLGLSGTTALQVSSAWDMPRQPAAPTIQGTWGAGGHGAPSAQPTDEDIEMLDAISLSGSGLVGLGVRMNAAQARRGYTPPRGY